jgi:hypothetical protein
MASNSGGGSSPANAVACVAVGALFAALLGAVVVIAIIAAFVEA